MKELWRNIKFTWKYAKNQKKHLILYILCNIFEIVMSIIVPILSAQKIVQLTSSMLEQLFWTAVIIVIAENWATVIDRIGSKEAQIIYRETLIQLQTELTKEILKLTNETIDQNGSGVFIQRLTNDVSRIADILTVANISLTEIISNIGILVAVFIINKVIFAYLVVMLIILFYIEHTRVVKYNEMDKDYRKQADKASGFVGEVVRGSRDIKMLNSEKSFSNEMYQQVYELNQKRYKMSSVTRIYSFFRGLLREYTDFFLLILLIYLIKDWGLSTAYALILLNYSGRLPSIIYNISFFLEKIKDFNLSSERVFSIIDGTEFHKETFGTKHLNKVNGDFEFKNVYFSYGENKVLKNLNFNIKANETVAFVGKSGAGKTTIFNLLCKMYDGYEGTITIDGVDIKELDKDSIRGNITIISQDPYIFHMSIRDNLRLMKDDLTEKEMIHACKEACLHDYIMSLPDGYDTVVGEGGVTLSGGQKQRLAIARALIQKTEIILFDEATSALDNETQASIQEAIANMKHEYTILIIAHRLSTIIHSDRILFLNHGHIEAQGTHEELLKKSKAYKHLYESEIEKSE